MGKSSIHCVFSLFLHLGTRLLLASSSGSCTQSYKQMDSGTDVCKGREATSLECGEHSAHRGLPQPDFQLTRPPG